MAFSNGVKTKRDNLRYYLKELGFGKVQGSCWVSPYDFSAQIHEFCNQRNILKYICLYEGRFFSGENIDGLVERVWGIEKHLEAYEKIIELCKENIETLKNKTLEFRKCYDAYFKIYSLFTETIQGDPFLPDKFLKDWPRQNAENLFKDFSRVVYNTILVV